MERDGAILYAFPADGSACKTIPYSVSPTSSEVARWCGGQRPVAYSLSPTIAVWLVPALQHADSAPLNKGAVAHAMVELSQANEFWVNLLETAGSLRGPVVFQHPGSARRLRKNGDGDDGDKKRRR